ncbi:cyclin-dependent kinase 2-interacting protein-like [Tubulanus polymorphus]|uniref:cyclin-dependent kinase 2-interacting protein-like n=1 Tax=Tubulanus polymorphus TaxID=672921 RepID=UPI003DA4F4F9
MSKEESNGAANNSLSFSPAKVVESRTPKQQGNLTGISRKVKDSCADLHNQIFKWDKLLSQGADLISSISNIKISSATNSDSEQSSAMPDELQPHCDGLEKIIFSMEKVVSKMKRVVQSLQGIAELDSHQQSDDTAPLFLTWPVSRFADVASEIVEMYTKEYDVKVTIKENVAHTTDRNLLMTYSAAWIHQIYVQSNSKFMLESMLIDTGLK